MQPAKATEGSSEKGDTHTQAKATQSPRKAQYIQRRRPRGSSERGDTHSIRTDSEPKKTTVHPVKETEGEQREGRHMHSSKRTQPQYSQQSDRGRHSKPLRKTEMKRVTNNLTSTAIGSPLALGKKGACAETEIA